MTRRFVNQLGHQEAVNQIFQAGEKQLRPNRNGNLYLQVELSDRSGRISARMWNASEQMYRSFENGDYVRVEGTTQLYQGAIQLIATNVSRARPDEVNPEDFLLLSSREIDRLTRRLGELVRQVKNEHLRNLAECVLMDEELMAKFTRAPAGVKNHHAYPGGLLEHVVNLLELAWRVAECYPALDSDLLAIGVLLHDIGKVDELCYEKEYAYTDAGQLLGHVVMGIGMLDQKLAETERLAGEPVPDELAVRLKHMIVSHHGEYAYGSPKLPMTLEAVALHQLDNLDAKLASFQQLMRDDANVDSPWTAYNQNLGRKLYKGSRAESSNGPGCVPEGRREE